MARKQKTILDYVVVGISPLLVTVMVTSLALFVSTILNPSPFLWQFNFVLVMYSMATVSIARISIEEGKERAVLFGVPLAAVTLLAMMLLIQMDEAVGGMKLIYCAVLIAVTWWSSHHLTWDCTVIEDREDSSNQGLLQKIGFENTIDKSDIEDPEQETHSSDNDIKKENKQSWFERWKENRKKPHTPGIWVIYYSLAALPLFGLGQLFTDTGTNELCFKYLLQYVASGLGLLLTTSLLGLRRYLRHKDVEMPHEMAGLWLTVGTVMILAFMALAFLLPRPGNAMQLGQLSDWFDQSQDDYDTSEYGIGPDGKDDGNQGSSSDQTDENSPSNSQQEGDEQENGQENGQGTSNDSNNSENASPEGNEGSQNSSDNQNNNQQAGNSDSQNDSGNQNDQGDQGDRGNQGDQSEQDGQGNSETQSEEGQDAPDGGASQSNNSPDNGATQAQQNESPSAENNQPTEAQSSSESESDRSESSSSQFPDLPSLGEFGTFIQIIFWIVVGTIFLFYLVRNYQALWNAVKEIVSGFFNWLTGAFAGTPREQVQHEETPVQPSVPRPPPFSSFSNPFTGRAQLSLLELVQYSFDALESLGHELGIERQEDQTPNEFSQIMAQQISPLGQATLRLGKHYSLAAYAPTLLNQSCLQDLQDFWQQLSKVTIRHPQPANTQASN